MIIFEVSENNPALKLNQLNNIESYKNKESQNIRTHTKQKITYNFLPIKFFKVPIFIHTTEKHFFKTVHTKTYDNNCNIKFNFHSFESNRTTHVDGF